MHKYLKLLPLLLLSLIVFARGPAVENLEDLDREQIQREKAGQQYSRKYNSLKGIEDKQSSSPIGVTEVFGVLLFLILPLGMWKIMMIQKNFIQPFEEEIKKYEKTVLDFKPPHNGDDDKFDQAS